MTPGREQPPRITIGITCFNAASTIERAIASAAAQDWPSVEILVVDDCSTDNSGSVVREALAPIVDARLIEHTENLGPAAARNTLLEAASGDFIAFFDDDDVSAPSRLTVQIRAILDYEAKAATTLVLCFASGEREYPNNYRLQADAIGSRPRPPVGHEVIDYLLFNERHPSVFYGAGTPTCALMARTELLRAVGGFDPSLRRVEDVDLAIRLALKGAHFIGCPERLYIQYATVAADKTADRNLAAELSVVEKYREYLKHRGLYDYARGWFIFRQKYFTRRYGAALMQIAWVFLGHPLRTTRHLFRSAPARLRHEWGIGGARGSAE
ncbi:MAG: glycosyltransferase family A protein [Gallionella sp.]|nr:glycosyltransferase family A protein [Gallionella sp.]